MAPAMRFKHFFQIGSTKNWSISRSQRLPRLGTMRSQFATVSARKSLPCTVNRFPVCPYCSKKRFKENSYIRRLAVSQGSTNGVLLGGKVAGKGNDFGWIDNSDWDYSNFYPSRNQS